MKETIINGMTKEELKDSIEGTKLMTEGLEGMLEQLELLEEGQALDNKVARSNKLKVSEGILIMNDIKEAQQKRAKIYNNKQFGHKKNGKR